MQRHIVKPWEACTVPHLLYSHEVSLLLSSVCGVTHKIAEVGRQSRKLAGDKHNKSEGVALLTAK